MLTDYSHAAMEQAILADDAFYGEIPALRDVLAVAATLKECRAELQEALEGWIIHGL